LFDISFSSLEIVSSPQGSKPDNESNISEDKTLSDEVVGESVQNMNVMEGNEPSGLNNEEGKEDLEISTEEGLGENVEIEEEYLEDNTASGSNLESIDNEGILFI